MTLNVQKLLADAERRFDAGDIVGCLALVEPNGKPVADIAPVLGMIGACCGANRDYKRAIRSLTRATQKDPNNPVWRHNLGAALVADGRVEQAIEQHRHAVRLAPHVAAFQSGLGNALVAAHRAREAVTHYRAALQIEPNFVEAVDNLGRILGGINRNDLALEYLERATRLDPANPDTWSALSGCLSKNKRPLDALAAAERAVTLASTHRSARGSIISLRHELAEWRCEAEDEATLDALVVQGAPPPPMFLLARRDDPALHAAATRALMSGIGAQKHPPAQQIALPAMASGKIKLLYFSADFREHPTTQLIRGLLQSHDRERFFVIAASVGADDGSQMRQQIRDAVDLFADVGYGTRDELVGALRSFAADIAIDTMGHTQGARTEVFLDRVAPIQVGYLGYPGTCGAKAFDYLIADPHVVTTENRPFITEKVVVLPRTYQPNDLDRVAAAPEPARPADFGLPDDVFVYACFNGARKFTRPVFDLWMEILREVPKSVLWLLGENDTVRGNMGREAEQRGIDPRRLMFGEFIKGPRHLQRYTVAGAALDTFPYGSHTTGSDALMMGCPLVALQGRSFASRVSTSLLHTVGLPELVATTPADYVRLAVRLATEPEFRASLAPKLTRTHLSRTLYNTALYTRELEWAINEMLVRHRKGLSPADITVPNFPPN